MVVCESYISSITQYQLSSTASSKDGFNTPLVFGIRTLAATAVPFTVSFPNQMADFLHINSYILIKFSN